VGAPAQAPERLIDSQPKEGHMKPELKIAITNASELVRASIWHQEHVRVRVEDLKALLEEISLKGKQGSVTSRSGASEEISRFAVPPEDFLEQLHDKAVQDLEELAGGGGVK
jgi:hypothetical protein